MNFNLTIDGNKCISCAKCINVCSHHIFYAESKCVTPNNPKCIKCFNCYAACPEEAIGIKGYDKPLNPETSTAINTESLTYLFSIRRSYRKFQDKEIDDNLPDKIIETGIYIPSGGNDRSFNFTVIKSDEIKKSLKNELVKIYKTRSFILNNFLFSIPVKPFLNKVQKEFLKNKEYGHRIKNLIDDVLSGGDPFYYNTSVIIIAHFRKKLFRLQKKMPYSPLII